MNLFVSSLIIINGFEIPNFILYILLFLAASGLFMWGLVYTVASYLVYVRTLSRQTPEQWTRERPGFTDENSLKMDAEGAKWKAANADYKQDVCIERDGLKLYGEYYDYGSDRCMVFLAGRADSLRYSYFFAKPYTEMGYNLLLIDSRAHGWSEGTYNTVGFEESRDVIAWVRFLQEHYAIRSVVFHGICVGGAGAILAITSPDCPEIVDGMVVEGMFPNFGESMKNNLRMRKKPVFIFYNMINMWMKHYTGHSMNYGPINVIGQMHKPILMLHGREDAASLAVNAQKMYDMCPSEQKELVWFDHGPHSMLRITDTPKYDAAIKTFFAKHFDAAKVQ